MCVRVVRQRLVGGAPKWGFDALGWFFPFATQSLAQEASTLWSDEELRRITGLKKSLCPLVEGGEG